MIGKTFKKIIRTVIIIILILLLIVFVIPRISDFIIKNKIINIVKSNQELLNNTVNTGSYKDALKIKGIKNVRLWTTDAGNTYIDYFCKGFGMAIYYGFYYHSIDESIGFQGESVIFERKGKGWYWSQPNGDNYCYTEKIIDNWYYYEAGF